MRENNKKRILEEKDEEDAEDLDLNLSLQEAKGKKPPLPQPLLPLVSSLPSQASKKAAAIAIEREKKVGEDAENYRWQRRSHSSSSTSSSSLELEIGSLLMLQNAEKSNNNLLNQPSDGNKSAEEKFRSTKSGASRSDGFAVSSFKTPSVEGSRTRANANISRSSSSLGSLNRRATPPPFQSKRSTSSLGSNKDRSYEKLPTRKSKTSVVSINEPPSLQEKIKIPLKKSSTPITPPKPLALGKEITVNVTTIMGKVYPILLLSLSSVGDLKDKVSELHGISKDSQMLVFCGKQLLDDLACLKAIGIQDQSNVQLVLKMAGGPGPPIQMKRLPQENDQVVFLLCKQQHELYVLEVHLKDGEKPRTVTRHHLRLKSPSYGTKLMEFLGSNEFFDISDLCELQIDLETQDNYEDDLDHEENQEYDVNEYEGDYFEDDTSEGKSRPITAESQISWVSSKKSSRPASGISSVSNISSDDESFQNLLWENEWLLNSSLPMPRHPNQRPATAISLMRLPQGSRPMIIIPKTRPATAEKWSESFRAHMLMNDHLLDEEKFLSSPTTTITSNSSSEPTSNTSIISSPQAEFMPFHQKPSTLVKANLPSPVKNSNRSAALPTRKLKTPILKKASSITYSNDVLEFTSKSRNPSRKITPKKNVTTPPSTTRKFTPSRNIATPRAKTPARTSSSSKMIVTRRCCSQCNKKLGPASVFTCKCEQIFCGTHRYSDRHACTYDFKTAAKQGLKDKNPLIKSEKLLHI